MKIDYRETTDDLIKRIDIHNQYGSKDIDKWMLDILPLQKGQNLLDIGCGAGKQCFSYYRHLQGEASITGGDVSDELLAQAIKTNHEISDAINFIKLDFDSPFNLSDNFFDLASCCFAIYYATDIPFTISEIHRVLKPGGVLFTTGPMPENKQLFYEIIREATGKEIPPMPGSSRYASAILSEIKSRFSEVAVHIFENPLVFESVDPFMEYTRASLSEDRKLWKSFFETKEDFTNIIDAIRITASKRLAEDGNLVMTKVVGGFLAKK